MEGGSCKVYLLVMEAVAIGGTLHCTASQELLSCKLLSIQAAKSQKPSRVLSLSYQVLRNDDQMGKAGPSEGTRPATGEFKTEV